MEYTNRVIKEINHYKNYTNVHDLPDIFHYMSNKYWLPKIQYLGFPSLNDLYITYIIKYCQNKEVCNILSIGSGNSDFELLMGKQLLQTGIENWTFTCVDINPYMLERGKKQAKEWNMSHSFNFYSTDINEFEISQFFDIVIANHSLHHIVELEKLFNTINNILYDDGSFITNDVIGRNGHMRWPEALEVLNILWMIIDNKYKYNHQLKRFEKTYINFDCSTESFEGIRAQDILPLLIANFSFEIFLAFANLTNIFCDRSFGHNFNPNSEEDRNLIDFITLLDDYLIEKGTIKPTNLIAVMKKKDIKIQTKYFKHLSPEFCLRDPNI